MTHATLERVRHIVRVNAGSVVLAGELVLPEAARAVVVLVDGGASPLRSMRDARVAGALQTAGVGTLLLDLLTTDELIIDDKTRTLRFDVGLLANRLIEVTDWIATQDATRGLPIGYFAGDAAAAAALIAAAARPRAVSAVVCRGGRPDRAGVALRSVRAATLLIVGGQDAGTIPLNEWAFHRLANPRELVLVDNATHLYESAEALDEVCRLTEDWFSRHLLRRFNDDAVPDPEC
jgi:putative phosphoribosyl transferase